MLIELYIMINKFSLILYLHLSKSEQQDNAFPNLDMWGRGIDEELIPILVFNNVE